MHAVAGINLLPGNKAVYGGLLGKAAHVGCNEHMHNAEPYQTVIVSFVADVALNFIDVYGVHEMVGGCVPRDHDVRGDAGKRIQRAKPPAVVPVPPAALPFYGLFLFH